MMFYTTHPISILFQNTQVYSITTEITGKLIPLLVAPCFLYVTRRLVCALTAPCFWSTIAHVWNALSAKVILIVQLVLSPVHITGHAALMIIMQRVGCQRFPT